MAKFRDKNEMLSVSETYKENEDNWKLLDLIYKSGRPLINQSLYRHPLESRKNHLARLRDGYVFNFAKSIVNIYNFYLNGKDVVRKLIGLENDPAFEMFKKDTNLFGTDYDVFWNEAQKFASAMGAIGVLVNKPGDYTGGEEVPIAIGDEIKDGIYPYYALYSLLNVLDWRFERDSRNHRLYLTYLKLYERDGSVTVWTPSDWERWRLHPRTQKPELFERGKNDLNEIPFLWLKNLTNLQTPEIGDSDILDIAPIITTIAQNLSCGEEMIKLAGFPIRREPMKDTDELILLEEDEKEEVPTGPRAIAEFDPQFGPAGKPDWMPTEVAEPIAATLNWIDRKIDEIYRIAHLSGIHAQRRSNNKVASGLSIRYEFSQLNSVLVAKAKNLSEAELGALRLWLKWQGQEDLFQNMEIKRSREFSIDEMAVALDNAITAMGNVMSKTFKVGVQRKIAFSVWPDATEDEKKKMAAEIEKNTPEKVEPKAESNGEGGAMPPTGSQHIVRNAHEAYADHSNDPPKEAAA